MAIARRGRVGQTLRLPIPALPDTAQALHAAIVALQAQRAVLGDAVVEQTVAALHDKLAALDVGAHDPQLKQVTVLLSLIGDVAVYVSFVCASTRYVSRVHNRTRRKKLIIGLANTCGDLDQRLRYEFLKSR